MPLHPAILASGAVVALAVAVSAAMATTYEEPEVRRVAELVRRRIAGAWRALENEMNPRERPPRFNRPEDATGFYRSRRGGAGTELGIDVDDETRRRQREELMFWNSVHQLKADEDAKTRAAETAASDSNGPRSATRSAATGADARGHDGAGLRQRSGFASSLYTNPFADEHHVDRDEVAAYMASREDHASDIYSATTRESDAAQSQSRTLDVSSSLIELSSLHIQSPSTLEHEPIPEEPGTASQLDGYEACASIQAWADDSSRNLYSPLSQTPLGPVSEPDVQSDGQLTPTDSVSVIGSSEFDLGRNATQHQDEQRPFDVLSEDSEGVLTPASWSDVGSVVSENDDPGHVIGHANTSLQR